MSEDTDGELRPCTTCKRKTRQVQGSDRTGCLIGLIGLPFGISPYSGGPEPYWECQECGRRKYR